MIKEKQEINWLLLSRKIMGHYENNNLLEKETEGRKYLIERERNGERGKWGGEKK